MPSESQRSSAKGSFKTGWQHCLHGYAAGFETAVSASRNLSRAQLISNSSEIARQLRERGSSREERWWRARSKRPSRRVGTDERRRFVPHPGTSRDFAGQNQHRQNRGRQTAGPTANRALARLVLHVGQEGLVQRYYHEARGHEYESSDTDDLLCPHHVSGWREASENLAVRICTASSAQTAIRVGTSVEFSLL
jgi:hypothetical protein